jgi:NAD(P)-dependent dehydrogenase (short-subunit alcohol dehydrogenase family)
MIDPAACTTLLYVVVLFCFQSIFMEWPFFDYKVMLLLIAAHVNFVMPTVLLALGLAGTVWKDTCIAWCPYIWLSSSLIAVAAYRYMLVGAKPSAERLDGKVCIITGANTGIGYETAEEFARLGATVIFGCRNEDRARFAMAQVARRVPDCEKRLQFIALDLSSLSSVRRFVKQFEAMGVDLHVLVLNAGVMLNSRQLTEDGLEMTLASNLFGHFLLVQLLLPTLLLEEARGLQPRIINVGSTFHLCHDVFDFDEVVCVKDSKALDNFMARPYELFNAYGHSKLGGMLINGELARRLAKKGSKIPANVLHPGQCITEVQRNMHPVLLTLYSAFQPLCLLFLKTANVGCWGTVHLATAPELATSDPATGGVSGAFFLHMSPTRLTAAADDRAAAECLWDMAVELTGAPDV